MPVRIVSRNQQNNAPREQPRNEVVGRNQAAAPGVDNYTNFLPSYKDLKFSDQFELTEMPGQVLGVAINPDEIQSNPFYKVCTLEMFGGLGDNSFDNSQAFADAYDALSAGTYNCLVLGAGTYYTSQGVPMVPNTSMFGFGEDVSAIRCDFDGNIFEMIAQSYQQSFVAANFRIIGTPGLTNQTGIASDSSTVNARNITVESPGHHGISINDGNAGNLGAISFLDCTVLYASGSGARAVEVDNAGGVNLRIHTDSCDTGLYVGTAAFGLRADVSIYYPTAYGVLIEAADGLDAGRITGVVSNASGAVALKVNNQTNFAGLVLEDMRFSGGSIELGSVSGAPVVFDNCDLTDLDAMTLTGAYVDFITVSSTSALTYSADDASRASWINFVNMEGNVPSYVGEALRLRFEFPTDANQALTPKQSTPPIFDMSDPLGVLTAPRTVTSFLSPNLARNIQVINRTSFTISYAWNSGATVDIPAGFAAHISSDGTDADVLWYCPRTAP